MDRAERVHNSLDLEERKIWGQKGPDGIPFRVIGTKIWSKAGMKIGRD